MRRPSPRVGPRRRDAIACLLISKIVTGDVMRAHAATRPHLGVVSGAIAGDRITVTTVGSGWPSVC
jgi:hypothetical protein